MDVVVHNNPIIATLATSPLFKAVEWQTIKCLADGAKSLRFERGQTIFHVGDSTLGLYLVKSGQVKLSMLAANGSERVVDVVSSGGTFGEAGLFSSMMSKVHAVMLTHGEVIEISGETLKQVLAACPMLALSMLSHFDAKLCRFVRELENCCLRTARQRVVDYLIMLVDEQQPVEREPISILLPASKGIIASLLDITPETFSRELNGLIGMGLIQVGRKTIKILDLSSMRQVCR